MENAIKISSIKDIVNVVTDENIQYFLNDFTDFLKMVTLLKKEKVTFCIDDFLWVNDHQNKLIVNIEEEKIEDFVSI